MLAWVLSDARVDLHPLPIGRQSAIRSRSASPVKSHEADVLEAKRDQLSPLGAVTKGSLSSNRPPNAPGLVDWTAIAYGYPFASHG